jgi:hypothetical protein
VAVDGRSGVSASYTVEGFPAVLWQRNGSSLHWRRFSVACPLQTEPATYALLTAVGVEQYDETHC